MFAVLKDQRAQYLWEQFSGVPTILVHKGSLFHLSSNLNFGRCDPTLPGSAPAVGRSPTIQHRSSPTASYSSALTGYPAILLALSQASQILRFLSCDPASGNPPGFVVAPQRSLHISSRSPETYGCLPPATWLPPGENWWRVEEVGTGVGDVVCLTIELVSGREGMVANTDLVRCCDVPA